MRTIFFPRAESTGQRRGDLLADRREDGAHVDHGQARPPGAPRAVENSARLQDDLSHVGRVGDHRHDHVAARGQRRGAFPLLGALLQQ
jgi:hypothetical protein